MKEEILTLFENLADREQTIKELRAEIKESIEDFCEEYNDFEPKAVKEAYKVFKNLSKDKSATTDQEFQRDKIVEILISRENNNGN